MEKKKKILTIIGIAVLLLCVGAFLVYAVKKSNTGRGGDQLQNSGMSNQSAGKNQTGVQAEVAASCQGKKEGDSCEATSPRNSDKQSGICKKMGNSTQLACLPANMPARLDGDVSGPAPQGEFR